MSNKKIAFKKTAQVILKWLEKRNMEGYYFETSAEAVEAALPDFIGEQDQIAPLFSAKSVDGVRAYELARKLYRLNGGSDSEDPRLSSDRHPLAEGGMSSTSHSTIQQEKGSEFDAAAERLIRVSRITISELELLDFERGDQERRMESEDRATLSEASSRINVTDNSALGLPRAVIRMACSKGTYVRAFARDLGEALGSGAHLDSLQRSRSGIFRVEDALSIDQAIAVLQ